MRSPVQSPVVMTTEFDRAIALTGSDGRFRGQVSEGFWVQSGPNGGYLTAVALHAATLTHGDDPRPPRSIHARFLAAPKAGDFEATVEVLRAGRSMVTYDIRLAQAGKLFLSASACFSGGFSDIEFQDCVMPEARPIGEAEPVDKAIPLNHRYDMWRAIGGELRHSERARTGGWIRFADPRPVDAYAVAALWDAWPPAMFARAMERRFRGAVPTVEVSVYFRRRLPLPKLTREQHVLLDVETTMVSEGIAEESGTIWAPDGRLLAHTRQLNLLI